MQQRRLRLGDVIDDYCPRERRITNHAVVAMIEDTVKQTRCTTCDADHEYKQARVPAARRRKTAAPAAHLVEGNKLQADLHDAPGEDSGLDDVPVMAGSAEPIEPIEPIEPGEPIEPIEPGEPIEPSDIAPQAHESVATEAIEVAEAETIEESDAESDEWPVHRPLIRATLPRPEGHTPERKAPDFTFRPSGGKFDPNRNGQRPRGGHHRPARQAHGHSPSGQGGSRFGGQRGPGQGSGGPQGQRHGNRSGQGGAGRPGQGPGQGRGPRPGGGRKRGR